MNILNRIEELEDLPVIKIRAQLTLDDYAAKDIAEALKELGLTTKKVAFADTYYGWLATDVRSKAEAKSYILGGGDFGLTSNNVQNHLNHFLTIHEMSERIWMKKV